MVTHHKTLMMGTEEISETYVFNTLLTRLITEIDFSKFIPLEIFKSYIMCFPSAYKGEVVPVFN